MLKLPAGIAVFADRKTLSQKKRFGNWLHILPMIFFITTVNFFQPLKLFYLNRAY